MFLYLSFDAGHHAVDGKNGAHLRVHHLVS